MNMRRENFITVSESFHVDADFQEAFAQMGLDSIESVFSFSGGEALSKKNLARHRSRVQFKVGSEEAVMFLKRYEKPPVGVQLKNWLSQGKRISSALCDYEAASQLQESGINTPRTIAYGQQWGAFFEKRSFVITLKIPDGHSLEKKLPDCFYQPGSVESRILRKAFLKELACFIRQFHRSGFRHRDLYLCHIFHDEGNGKFYLIDLARAFKPKLFAYRFFVKDLAQLYYSAPGSVFSKTDRLRFYLYLTERRHLSDKDKRLAKRTINKAKRMAEHDIKHGRTPPFATTLD